MQFCQVRGAVLIEYSESYFTRLLFTLHMWLARKGKMGQQNGMLPWRKVNGDHYCRRKHRGLPYETYDLDFGEGTGFWRSFRNTSHKTGIHFYCAEGLLMDTAPSYDI